MATLTTSWQDLNEKQLYGSQITVKLQGKYSEQSTDGNKTKVQFKIITGGTDSFRTTSGAASLSGQFSKSESIATYPDYIGPGATLVSVDEWIGHNADGTKSFNMGGNVYGYIYQARREANFDSVSVSLPRINRVSPITGFTGSDVEGDISATYTQYVSSYTQKLRIAINGGATLQTFDNYASGSNVTLGSSAVTAIQNYMNTNSTKQVTLAAVIETWNGSTKIGESDAKTNVFTFSNANPTISNTETETDTNVITYYGTGASTVVQNVSKVQCQVTATAQKGATIYNVSIVHNGVTYPTTLSSGKYIATIPMSANNFVINVADNRGNSSTKTVTKTMVAYTPVDFTAFTIKRVNSTSSNIRFDIEAKYYQQTFNGTANAPIIKYKKDEGNFVTIPSTEYSIDTTNHKVTITNYVVNDLLVYTSPAQFTLYIEDKLTNDTDGGTKGYVTKGIGTLDMGEHDVQVNGELYIATRSRTNAQEIRDLIHPVGSIYLSVEDDTAAKVAARFGGTWVQVSEGRALFGAGSITTTYNVNGTSTNFTDTYSADTNYAAGLPNIVGTGHYADNNGDWSGALYNVGSASYIGDGSASGTRIGLDASRNKSIYGNSNTVQPNAYAIYVWKRTA